MQSRVLAVVVTYQANIEALSCLLDSVVQQVQGIIVVDNGSTNATQITQCVHKKNEEYNCGLTVDALIDNFGLGYAHNVGIKKAKKEQYDYVLLLDQDSIPQKQMVENLYRAFVRKSESQKVSATGAIFLQRDQKSTSFFVRNSWGKLQRFYDKDKDTDNCIQADILISSGSLISLKNFDSIGLMDESLFIDHVDTEWFLRANHLGFTAFGVCDAIMQHGLGEKTHKVRLFKGRVRHIPQHKPFRYYYTFRNSLLLYKRGYASGKWRWNDVQRLVMITLMYTIFKAPRWGNAKMITKGIWHGLLGRTGKL